LDPVVRLMEKRGIARLWSVVIVFIAILLGATLLVAAVVPGIQRGHHNLKSYLQDSTKSKTAKPADASADSAATPDDNEHLGTTLELELREIEQGNRNNPIGWLLTEIDDQGNVVETGNKRSLDSFAQSRGGRMLFEYKGAIFKTAREWVTAGSTRILGFLGLVLGMIMVPVYLA
jgi:hypothetical protein